VMTIRRPPKKNLTEVIKLIEREIEQCKKRALSSQAFADRKDLAINTSYWQRDATAQIRKAQRLGLVVEWMEKISDAR